MATHPLLACLVLLACVTTRLDCQSDDPPRDEFHAKLLLAIDKGKDVLLDTQTEHGTWDHVVKGDRVSDETIGTTALSLLVFSDRVRTELRPWYKGIAAIRQVADRPDFVHTDSICEVILLLHCLPSRDDSPDIRRIRVLADRLVKAQKPDGTWPRRVEGQGQDNGQALLPPVALFVARDYVRNRDAIKALDKSIALAANHFRTTQRPDGSWREDLDKEPHSFASGVRTCEALLAIAVDTSVQDEYNRDDIIAGKLSPRVLVGVHQALEANPQVQHGLKHLAAVLKKQTEHRVASPDAGRFFFLLAQVGDLYRVKGIQEIDWHRAGCLYLLDRQEAAGVWQFGPKGLQSRDSSHALLFLRKVRFLSPLQVFSRGRGDISVGPVLVPRKSDGKKVDPVVYSAELAKKLLDASPGPQRDFILKAFEEERGSEYTMALAETIEKLSNDAVKESAREVLRKRLQRLKNQMLIQYMDPEEHVEVRRAAALAARYKNDVENASALIPLLADKDPNVQNEALIALKSLTAQDFGKDTGKWQEWLKRSRKNN